MTTDSALLNVAMNKLRESVTEMNSNMRNIHMRREDDIMTYLKKELNKGSKE